MNFSADDVHRSLRRYVDLALGDAWKTYTERDVIADSARPAAVVEFSTPVTLMAGARPDRRTIPQGDVGRMATFAVQAYPELFDTAREGRVEATRVAQLLEDTVTLGLVESTVLPGAGVLPGPETLPSTGADVGHPGAIPVYDFAAAPAVGAGRSGSWDRYGWAMVEDVSVQPIQDPLDAKRWTVAMSLRLSWWRAGRAAQDAPIVTSMPGTYEGEAVVVSGAVRP